MKRKREIIKTDGSAIAYQPSNGRHYELDELQSIVGGWVQIIDLNDGWQMVVNEEAKQYALPYNSNATEIAHEAKAIFDNDFVAGDVLICKNNDII